jgi:hypothetical protein
VALALIADLGAGRLARLEPPAQRAQPLTAKDLRDFLERIASWDNGRWLDHEALYRTNCGPLPFLPPECQNAVVVQATLGHRSGVGFGLSRASERLVRSPAEFDQHARDVAVLWGRRLVQSRVVFLAGTDVIHGPLENVKAYLGAITRTFPIEPKPRGGAPMPAEGDEPKPRFDGVHLFLDDFDRPRPDRAGWAELATLGLIRTSLGVESGDSNVRTIYQESWSDEDLRATVADIKSAGLGISLLTLVGAGGALRANSHVERTARLIESLELGPGDFVFLLDEHEIGDPNLIPEDLAPLRGPAWSEQQAKLKEALAPLKKRAIKVLPYTLEKQWM